MRSASLASVEKANLGTDQVDGRFAGKKSDRPTGRLFSAVMRKAHGWWENKAAAELAALLGVTVRSAERYLAGDRSGDAEVALRLIVSTKGPQAIELLIGQLPVRRQRAMWNELVMAAERADLRLRRLELEEEIRRTEAEQGRTI